MEYTAEHDAEITLRKLLFLMETLPDDERLHIIGEIEVKYCRYCGSDQGYACYCMDDD